MMTAAYSTPNMMGYSSYKVVKKLGEGAFGEVYEVTKNSETYALKKIPICNFDEQMKLSKEIEVLRRLRHNNVVYFVESFPEYSNLCIVMEYCNGGDLNSLLVLKNPDIEKSTLMDYILQIGTGLAYLHNSSIIHRDIKPDNIMIAESGGSVTVKLTDFGLARIWETNGSPYYNIKYGIKGPKYYTAPEVFCEGKVTEKSDIFSMGCLIMALFSRTQIQWPTGKRLLAPYINFGFFKEKQICDANESEKKIFIVKYVDTAFQELVEKMVHSYWRFRPSAEEVISMVRIILEFHSRVPSYQNFTRTLWVNPSGITTYTCQN